ncbi:MAG: MBL fold metallo-hydrolase [Deltaproteobacteria bacterium]|nr:MAG: MBL fold metallo-hydrolase [Deltaproteobacteria bacterium]
MTVDFHVTPLRSGSSGNLTLVSHGGTTLLVDAGLPSQRGLSAALAEAGCAWDDVDAVLVSHLHSDHVNPSAVACCARHEVPIHLHRKNLDGFVSKVLSRSPPSGPVRTFGDGETFSVGRIAIKPFRVPHDARGVTCGFAFTPAAGERNVRVTMATDLGRNDNGLFEEFVDSDLILIEANYDEGMLNRSGRHDRGRVGSDVGHFSNAQAGIFLVRVLQESRKSPKAVILCHLSADHNTPELARGTVREILSAHRFDGVPVHAARRGAPLRKFTV